MANNIPPIPQDISSDGREIFDWAANIGNAVAKQQKINELKNAIHKPATCGACDKWMCSSLCPREVHQKSGRYVGPSMNDSICNQFQEKAYDTERRKKLKEELDKLLGS
jgi:hypothetical protein